MINISKLKDILIDYKKEFIPKRWEGEKYKWQAVQHFQKNWDVTADDFLEMFTHSIAKTDNLLAAMNYFPGRMIKNFAEVDREATRAMFINLYDETKDLAQRIEEFGFKAEALRQRYDEGTWNQHFQNSNSISTYLWLRYPDKYYIYQYSECRTVAKELDSSFSPKKGSDISNLVGALNLYNQINAQLADDGELVGLLQSVLDDSCYPDSKLKTLTIDVGFYISRVYSKKIVSDDSWFPTDYNPNIPANQWLELLADERVFTQSSLEIMKRIKDYGGMATCTELAMKYGETKNFYNAGSSSLARRVAKATGCPTMTRDTRNARWWPILYVGKYAGEETEGSYIWKLRSELSAALDNFDLGNIKLYAEQEKTNSATRNYWWLTANPRIWSFADLAVGGIQGYTLYNERGNKRRIFQNFLDTKVGDLVIGYESSPAMKIVALGNITDRDDEQIYFEKAEGLPNPITYAALKDHPELEDMEFFANMQGSLFKLTKAEYDFVMDLIREENPFLPETIADSYTKQDFLNDVYMAAEDFDTLSSLLKNKRNLILEGPPGVGKTFAAKRIAYAIMGEKRESNIEFIQFHQSYSYEDFVMGYKPRGETFELEHGVFYRFCQKAANRPNEPFFFIIDEINRGNMGKIFGELLMLIEKAYRGTKVTLAYDKMPFSVPENVYIIGMMNTADRSLAMIDYALRRRFSFYEMKPGFSSEGFKNYQSKLDDDTFDALIGHIQELNKEIIADQSLGKGFCIGHSYFCEKEECTDQWMVQAIEHDILPMLQEYWFDEETKLVRWENILRGVFND